jgi:hypothetical protein
MRQLRPFLMNAVQGISIRFCLMVFGAFVVGCDATHEDPATTEVARLKERSHEPSASKEHAKSVDEALQSDDDTSTCSPHFGQRKPSNCMDSVRKLRRQCGQFIEGIAGTRVDGQRSAATILDWRATPQY